MRKLLNEILRKCVWIGLRLYFGKISVVGKSHLGLGPMIIVANHQNALLDALLIATHLGLKPYYLARASIFKHKLAASLLQFIQLLPVFRVRDGIQNLSRNQLIFQQCAALLSQGNSILIFPEGNHSLNRYLRPLSKGFTRIVSETFKEHPNLPLSIQPVGINYSAHQLGGSDVSVIVGKPIPVANVDFDPIALKEATQNSLRALSIQIDEIRYHAQLQKHITEGTDLTDPSLEAKYSPPRPFGRILLTILYFPIFALWKVIKVKISDPVFFGTIKFLIGFVGVPLYLLGIGLIFANHYGIAFSLAAIAILVLAFVLFRRSQRQA